MREASYWQDNQCGFSTNNGNREESLVGEVMVPEINDTLFPSRSPVARLTFLFRLEQQLRESSMSSREVGKRSVNSWPSAVANEM